MEVKREQKYRTSRHSLSRNVYRTTKIQSSLSINSDEEKGVSEEIKEKASDISAEASNRITRQFQRKRMKRKYAEMKKHGQIGSFKDRVIAAFKTSFFHAKEYFSKNPNALWMMVGGTVLLMGVLGMCSSCAAMFQSSAGAVLGTSYTAEDEEIFCANDEYCRLEENVRDNIEHIETIHSGYDEYRYELQEISHNPYELISYLTVIYEDFKYEQVQQELLRLCSMQYMIQLEEEIEIRTREEERIGFQTVINEETGLEETKSYTYMETIEYEYKILNVILINNSLDTVINQQNLSADQMERYKILLETKGNRAYLFGDDIYSNVGEYLEYDIPGEALTDTEFAKLIREAEKHLGRSYVWGGSTPQTGFDCSGYICWIFNQTGRNVGRTTANGLMQTCDIIRPSEAKPGDLIFFKGTYGVSGASHVGLYVGNNIMLHCGNPISYANISSSYWQEHFYCFGRI